MKKCFCILSAFALCLGSVCAQQFSFEQNTPPARYHEIFNRSFSVEKDYKRAYRALEDWVEKYPKDRSAHSSFLRLFSALFDSETDNKKIAKTVDDIAGPEFSVKAAEIFAGVIWGNDIEKISKGAKFAGLKLLQKASEKDSFEA